MRVSGTEIKYLKSAARLLNREYVVQQDLDLSTEVLWVSVGQRAAEIWAVKKILLIGLVRPALPAPGRLAEFFLTSNFDSQ